MQPRRYGDGSGSLGVVVERELQRCRAQTHLGGLLTLHLDVLFEQIARKDIASQQELVIRFERTERLIERPWHRANLRLLRRAHLIDVAVERPIAVLLWQNALLDATQARQQYRGERQIGVRCGVWRAELDALRLRIFGIHRDAHSSGAVAL